MNKFSDDIGMSFGLDKCNKTTFNNGKLTGTTSVVLDGNTVIKDLEHEKLYKYLGFDESNGIQQAAKQKN